MLTSIKYILPPVLLITFFFWLHIPQLNLSLSASEACNEIHLRPIWTEENSEKHVLFNVSIWDHLNSKFQYHMQWKLVKIYQNGYSDTFIIYLLLESFIYILLFGIEN